MAKDFSKSLKSPKFIEILDTLTVMLLSLTVSWKKKIRTLLLKNWKILNFNVNERIVNEKKWVSLKVNLSRNNLKQQYTSSEWALKQIFATINCEEYLTTSSFAKIAYIIPENWPERGGKTFGQRGVQAQQNVSKRAKEVLKKMML